MSSWWKEGVVYQIYPRSFADSNGDGIGDLNGIAEHLEYVKDLGADIIWLNPCYASPNDDNGYDISDYRGIMKEFGTMEDFDRLLAKAHSLGIRIVMDLVVNHTSDEHAWFIESRSSRDNPKRDWYIWRDKPNNWGSCFGGSAWEYDEKTGQYYLHLFSRKQPDLNWENPEVRNAVYDLMRFWGDKGIDGFRMDVITMISKDQRFPDGVQNGEFGDGTPYVDNGPRVHEFLKEMNREAISRYDWMTVGEGCGAGVEDALAYTDEDNHELNMIFSFEHMNEGKQQLDNGFSAPPFSLVRYKEIFRKWQYGLSSRGWNSLYLENHDQVRCVSRYGCTSTLDLWKKSAKMLGLMYFMMKGTPYIYQGQELGQENYPFTKLEEFQDIAAKNDIGFLVRHGRTLEEAIKAVGSFSRDNTRTPMHWDSSENAGFTTAKPWLQVSPDKDHANVKDELADPDSILAFYKAMIRIRKENPVLVYGSFTLLAEDDEDLFIYTRTDSSGEFLIAANFSGKEAVPPVPLDGEIVLGNYSGRAPVMRPYECMLIRRR